MCDKMAISAYILKIVEKDPFLRLQMRAKEMFTIVCSMQKKQVEKQPKKVLMNEKENIENLIEINYCESKVKELDTIKKRIKDIEDKKAEGHRFRARMPNFEETEGNIT